MRARSLFLLSPLSFSPVRGTETGERGDEREERGEGMGRVLREVHSAWRR
jgi:hypothetical protein